MHEGEDVDARRFDALVVDYDGTLAEHGHVPSDVVDALRRVRASGRRLVLATGRELEDLMRVFGPLDVFDAVVAENGALLYTPSPPIEIPLTRPPPPELVSMLAARGVSPIAAGRIIVATWEPHEETVLSVIRELGLELEVIFNKGAVMILPTGVNKASGLRAALAMLGVPPWAAIAVGDAENDHSLLEACGLGIAVANAVPSLKARAHLVARGERGEGVREVVEDMLAGRI